MLFFKKLHLCEAEVSEGHIYFRIKKGNKGCGSVSVGKNVAMLYQSGFDLMKGKYSDYAFQYFDDFVSLTVGSRVFKFEMSSEDRGLLQAVLEGHV